MDCYIRLPVCSALYMRVMCNTRVVSLLYMIRHGKHAGDVRRPRGNEIMCGEQFCQCGQDPSGLNRVMVELG